MSKRHQTIQPVDKQEFETGYIPRTQQFQLHKDLKRFSVVVCHRRFGKSVFAINHLINKALKCKLPMPRYAFIAPTYGQAKRIAWSYLHMFTEKIPGVTYNEAELRVDFAHNGARIMILSAENYVGLKGIYLDGGILDEFADMNPAVWREALRPTLSDRKGWCLFLGTPRGQNHFYELYEYAKSGKDPDWYCQLFRASETGIIDAKELASAKLQMTEEEYEQEYEVSFNAGLIGAYFAKELTAAEKTDRIRHVPLDRQYPVDTYWDLGINDVTAIWFGQTIRGEHRFVDYYEASGLSLAEILADVQKKGFVLGEFVLPHDAKARDLSTGKSQQQIFNDLGCRRVRIIPRIGTKRDSINAARMVFPKCWFDKEKCEKGLKTLANYQRKWDSKNNVFQDTPLHNWASNGADAFQQFAMGVRGDSRYTETMDPNGPGIQAETEYSVFGD